MILERAGRFVAVGLTLAMLLSSGTPGLALAPQEAPSPSPPAPPPGPAKGEVLAPFDAQGVDGESYRVDYPKGTTTLLLFFLSGCPHCQRMLPEWGRLYQQRRDSLKVLGVIMDREPPGFFTAAQIPFQVVRAPSPEFLRSYKISKVPATIRVAPGGKVEDLAVGPVDGIRLGELFRP
jgi:hypothetical protein